MVENKNQYASSGMEFLPEPGPIRYSFVAQTAPAWWVLVINYLTYATIFWIRYHVVCVTDEAIYVLRGSKFTTRPRELVATLPRETRLGPVTGPRWSKIQLLGERHWVHRRFYPDIRGADHRGQVD